MSASAGLEAGGDAPARPSGAAAAGGAGSSIFRGGTGEISWVIGIGNEGERLRTAECPSVHYAANGRTARRIGRTRGSGEQRHYV